MSIIKIAEGPTSEYRDHQHPNLRFDAVHPRCRAYAAIVGGCLDPPHHASARVDEETAI